jgi:hypothetical protein
MEEVVMKSLIEALITIQSEWMEKYSSIFVSPAISKQQKPKAFYQSTDDCYIAVEQGLETDLRRHSRLNFDHNQHGDIEVNIDYLAAKYASQMFSRCSPLQPSPYLHFSDSPSKSLKQLIQRLKVSKLQTSEDLPVLPVQSNLKQVEQLETVVRIICCSIEDRSSSVDGNDDLILHVTDDIQSLIPHDILKNIKVCDLELVRRRIQLEKYKDRLKEWEEKYPDSKHNATTVPLKDQIKEKTDANNKSRIIELLKILFVDIFTPEATPEQLKAELTEVSDYDELDNLLKELDQQEVKKLLFSHVPALIHHLEQ